MQPDKYMYHKCVHDAVAIDALNERSQFFIIPMAHI